MNHQNPLPIAAFSFAVSVSDPAFMTVGRESIARIDDRRLRTAVARRLVVARGRLTGAHVRFARFELSLTLNQLASELGVTHPAVIRWEKAASEPTRMNRCSEIVLRQLLAEHSGLEVTASEIRAAVCDVDRLPGFVIPFAEVCACARQGGREVQWIPGTAARNAAVAAVRYHAGDSDGRQRA